MVRERLDMRRYWSTGMGYSEITHSGVTGDFQHKFGRERRQFWRSTSIRLHISVYVVQCLGQEGRQNLTKTEVETGHCHLAERER